MGHRQARRPLGRNLHRLSRIQEQNARRPRHSRNLRHDRLGPGPCRPGRRSRLHRRRSRSPFRHGSERWPHYFLRAQYRHGSHRQTQSRPNHRRPQRRRRLRPQTPRFQWQALCCRFLLGRRTNFPLRHQSADLAAAFVFYGPPPDKDAMARIKAPVYGFYAGNDARIGATVPDTIANMKALGKTYEPVTYEGAGHGFMRAGEAPDASEANKKAREEAWARWKSLLKQ